ncbi:MAG: hypothetical protein KME50_09220 [Nostoc desertorum CM1-VF14]|jgi:hypothetical protein|nr:hypothetical protein [Nostoc desertorum CM1-VF14]
MTKYSIPAETPAQNGFTLTTDAHQQDVESFAWESRMSRLVGFEEESSSPDTQSSEDSATPQESLSQPQEVQTKQPLSSNPFAKLGLVGAATLAIVLVGGVFLSQLMSGSNQKPKDIVPPQVPEQPTNESSSQQLEGEVDTLKTKLALTEQAQMVKAAQQQLRTAKSTQTAALQDPSVSSRGRQRVIPTPPPTAYVPRTVTVERIVKVPASQPLPSPQLPVVKPNTQPVVNITPPAPPNPFEEWRRLAKLGSYGQVNATNQPNNVAAAPEPAANNPQPQEETPPPETPAPAVSQEQPLGQKSLAVGTSAKAVLATAIFGETTTNSGGGDETGDGKNVFVIKSKEALKSKDGTTVIPANSEFLAEISSINEQGLLQMNVTKVISQSDGNPTEQSLPNNAIIIRGTQGKPLMAGKFPGQSSSIASMDLGLFVLGGLGKAAELVNRPDTKVVFPTNPNPPANSGDGESNNNSYIAYPVTETENRRNLAAAVVEGGFNSVVPQIAQRNQQAIAQMSQPTNVWFMRAGTTVELYVNQAI